MGKMKRGGRDICRSPSFSDARYCHATFAIPLPLRVTRYTICINVLSTHKSRVIAIVQKKRQRHARSRTLSPHSELRSSVMYHLLLVTWGVGLTGQPPCCNLPRYKARLSWSKSMIDPWLYLATGKMDLLVALSRVVLVRYAETVAHCVSSIASKAFCLNFPSHICFRWHSSLPHILFSSWWLWLVDHPCCDLSRCSSGERRRSLSTIQTPLDNEERTFWLWKKHASMSKPSRSVHHFPQRCHPRVGF